MSSASASGPFTMSSARPTQQRPGHGVDVWSSPEWRAGATAWLDERLREVSIERTGAVDQPHVRPWATVLSAPTDAGRVWLKAAGPGTSFEVGLYEVLARSVPEHVLVPLALDLERGWMVLPDGGVPLGEKLGGEELAAAMEKVLPLYADLQLGVAGEVDALLAGGAADMRPAAMPARFEEALAGVRGYVDVHGDAADRATLARLERSGPLVAGWCEHLATSPVPLSVDHNDLHAWNVLVGNGTPRFYDWGDSVVAHPFASMLLGLGFVQQRILEVEPGDPRILRLRDAYLEPFTATAPAAELAETLELACRVGKIARSLVWGRTVRADPEGERWQRAPFSCLAAILDDSHLTGA